GWAPYIWGSPIGVASSPIHMGQPHRGCIQPHTYGAAQPHIPPPRTHMHLKDIYGPNVAAAAFTLSLGGSVRYEGQEQWLRPHGPWQERVLQLRSVPVWGLDLSACPVTYSGLGSLEPLPHLAHLDLSACPHVDDWTVARMRALAPSLRSLSLSRCPRVTERGLATLHHFRELRHLDVSGLNVPSPGLVRILLEEMLPGCRIVGMELDTPPKGTT
uniref:Zer-1-like leucine-rich repeats region domain-containing protein n=1 Tax=Melopsittacus undulatus TaxID=13146 RepID=A0A8V5GMQ3_MELUD